MDFFSRIKTIFTLRFQRGGNEKRFFSNFLTLSTYLVRMPWSAVGSGDALQSGNAVNSHFFASPCRPQYCYWSAENRYLTRRRGPHVRPRLRWPSIFGAKVTSDCDGTCGETRSFTRMTTVPSPSERIAREQGQICINHSR